MTDRTLVGYDRLLDVFAAQAELLATAVQGADPESIVPGCPGLTLAETARHVGSQYRMVRLWLREGTRPMQWQREPGRGQDLAAYIRAGTEPLLAELAAHDPAEPCSTWWDAERNFGFWRRRMAHETTVHRCDIQGATGVVPDDVPDDAALDGIDEVLTLWFVHRLRVLNVAGTRDQVVSVQAGGREWLARAGTDRTRVHRPGDPPDTTTAIINATVSGAPTQVLLWLWGRRPDRAIRIDDSHDAVAQLWALLRLATR